MGADLYMINRARDKRDKLYDIAAYDSKASEAEKKKARKELDLSYDTYYTDANYFRDSYNNSSLMWQIGLSWCGDVIPMCDEAGVLSPDGCLELVEMILRGKNPADKTPEEFRADGFNGTEEGETAEDWKKYFVDKRKKLIKFLRKGASGRGIDCSL